MDFNLDEDLIEEVRKRPFIFDFGHKDYKDINKKAEAWKEISLKLNLSETVCKNRWKGLRNTYMRVKRVGQSQKKTGTGFPRRRWQYWKNLTFLDDVKKSKPTGKSRTFQDVWLEVCDGLDSNDGKEPTDYEAIESSTPVVQELQPNSPAGEVLEEFVEEHGIDNDLEKAALNVSKICHAFRQKCKQTSTELLFQSLARKVREANLPMSTSNQLNAKVVALVFSEIQDYQDYVYNESQ